MQDPDGSWRLSASYDHCTGKRISMAFEQMVRTYRNGADRCGPLTPQQRRADALANLITGEGAFGRPKATLLVIADYDGGYRASGRHAISASAGVRRFSERGSAMQ